MPLQFGDLDEARAYQELIVRRTAHLLGETYARITVAKIEMRHAPTADTPGETIDPCYIPTMLLTERDAYIADVRRWCQAFRPMLGPLLLSSDPKTVIGASMLMIEALNAEIDLAGAFFTEECSYDVLLPHYKEIVYLSQIVSQRDDEILPKDVPTFSLSAGNAWCLYDTASRSISAFDLTPAQTQVMLLCSPVTYSLQIFLLLSLVNPNRSKLLSD